MDPAGDSVPNVDAVGVQPYAAGSFQRLEPPDGGEQLHSVVRGQRLTAGKLSLLVSHAQEHAPAARTRVAAAGPIGEDLDFRRLGQKAARAAI